MAPLVRAIAWACTVSQRGPPIGAGVQHMQPRRSPQTDPDVRLRAIIRWPWELLREPLCAESALGGSRASVLSPPHDQAQADPTQHPGTPLQLHARHLLSGVQANHPSTELGGADCLGAVHAAVADQHHIDARACLDCDDERSELFRQSTIRSLKHACWCRDVSSSPPPDTFDCHGGIHRTPLTCTYVSPPCPHRPSESRPYERHGGLCVENL